MYNYSNHHELMIKINLSRKEKGLMELSPNFQKLLNNYLWTELSLPEIKKGYKSFLPLKDYRVNKKPFVLKTKNNLNVTV